MLSAESDGFDRDMICLTAADMVFRRFAAYTVSRKGLANPT
jgi:hypothetical protein